jgi:hypothetical protein
MGLETGTYIEDLIPANPAGTDPKSQGDDHIQLIKSTIQNSFPNTTGAWTTSDPIAAGAAVDPGQLMQLGQLPPVAFGNFDLNGVKLGGSSDWTVARTGEGSYRITFDAPAASANDQAIIASGSSLVGVTCNYLIVSESILDIKTYVSATGALADTNVMFARHIVVPVVPVE